MTTRESKGSSGFDLEKKLLGETLTFGQALEGLRVSEGLSQTAFAKKLGISRQYVCDVEKGRRLVSPEQAARFASVFRHLPAVFVQLALQDSVLAGGLKLRVRVDAA